ncbi:MAG: hypothetical protein ACFFAH_07765 [Promethearchaeota archaeon]
MVKSINKFYYLLLPLGEVKKKVKQGIKKYYKLIISSVVGIVLPWIFSLIFISVFNRTLGLSYELEEDSGLLFRIMIFYTFNSTYELPVVGNGFWPCFIIWAIPGLIIGFILKNLKLSLISSLIGLGTNYVLYVFLVFYPAPTFPNDMIIDSMIFPRLYANFSLTALFYLLFHISFYSFVFPVLILFTVIGNKISPKRRYSKPQFKIESTALEEEIPIQPILKLEQVAKTEKKKKLRGFAGVIYKQFYPLNDNDLFREKFKKTSLKFVLNPIDQLKAAIVIFSKGTVEVEEYKKMDPLMKMDKKLIRYNAMLQVTTEILLNIAMGKMSVVQLLIAERKDKNIKVKGKLKLLKLLKALKLLEKSLKEH